MTCNEVRQLADEWVHGELDENRRRAVGEHLCSCADCDAALRAEKSLSVLLGSSSPKPSGSVSSSVLSAIRKEKQKAAREKMRTFTKYASIAAMLVLVIGITSALVYTGVFRRSGGMTDDPVSTPGVEQTPGPDAPEMQGSVKRFLSGYPGTEAVVIGERPDTSDLPGIQSKELEEITVYLVAAEQKEAFLSLCGENGIGVSEADGALTVPEDAERYLSGLAPAAGDLVVFLITG